jgi:hypothetical protein
VSLTPIVISLCDRTGNMVEDWAAAGYECWCVDLQHSIRRERVAGRIHYVWGDCRSWLPPRGRIIAAMFAFLPCTHLTVSGARDFKSKAGWMLADALQLFDSCRMACEYSRALYAIENPLGRLNTHRCRPDYTFDPCDYAGYLPIEQQQQEAYTKQTCLWTGGGFVMPPSRPVIPTLGSLMHSLPPSDDRADLRSVTPRGFARAVFEANSRTLELRRTA